MKLFAFVIVFNTALAATLLVVPLARFLSFRFGIISVPGGRRQEPIAMPKLGGLAIFIGFMAGIIVAQMVAIERQDPNEIIRLSGLILGSIVIFILGVVDDIFDLSYLHVFAGQALTSAIAIGFQIFIEFFNNPLTGTQTDPWSPGRNRRPDDILARADDEHRQSFGWLRWLGWRRRLDRRRDPLPQ